MNEWFILSYGTLWFDTCAYHIFLPDKTRFYHQLCWKVKSVGWQKKVTFKDLSALKFCGLASEDRPSCPTIINYLSHPTTSLPPLIQPSQNYAIDRALLNPIPCHLVLAHWFPPSLTWRFCLGLATKCSEQSGIKFIQKWVNWLTAMPQFQQRHFNIFTRIRKIMPSLFQLETT